MSIFGAFFNRKKQTQKPGSALRNKRKSEAFEHLMFEATPLSVSLWDKNLNVIDCNLESAKLFGLADKKDFIENFAGLSPKLQPCGRESAEMARECVSKAFADGSYRFEWTHQKPNGEYIPSEIILVKVEYKGEPIVAAYIRDLRELKKTLNQLHKKEDDLMIALLIAENNAKAKSEFLDNMSYELRTPTNGVIGFLRMAAQAKSVEEQRRYISDAERSAVKLMDIIADVLDFTDIENNKIKVLNEPFSIADIFDDLRNAYYMESRAKNLEFNVRIPMNLPGTLIGDSKKLRKIFACLIDNAVKFTEKGKISVRASVSKQTDDNIELCFFIKDTGIGMKPDQMKWLFTPFWQADVQPGRKRNGSGMGLAVVKHLVGLLGGKIWAESDYEEGSTFYFTARFGLPEEAKEKPPQTDREIEDLIEECEAKNSARDDGAQKVNSAHLLIVEDVEINQIIAEELLTSMGFTVDIANNGQEAIDMLASRDYGAVLMDIQMPVMDGLSATAKIRESDKFKDLPIIALTAHTNKEDMEKSFAYGMNDHINKPVNPEILYETLSKWFQPE